LENLTICKLGLYFFGTLSAFQYSKQDFTEYGSREIASSPGITSDIPARAESRGLTCTLQPD
jgi:hypothetical protein